mmetsp:Transcript_10679/g.21972  ORF Transcript_10679/g.21972 Transcript_10679/m.21972 type:complete len:244 (+) Transcript_10679:79-810(+)
MTYSPNIAPIIKIVALLIFLSPTTSFLPVPKLPHPQRHLSSSPDSSNPNITPQSAFTLNEFSTVDELQSILSLSSQPMPNRPDGVVVVVKYTSISLNNQEGGYISMSRDHPDTLFLRIFKEYDNSDATFAYSSVSSTPTYDIYSSGRKVGRVVGENLDEVEGWVTRYGYVVSKTDLFSEGVDARETLKWKPGQGDRNTPRTTAAFIPGYDWDKKGGFFDETAKEMEDNFMDTFENWRPDVDDD